MATRRSEWLASIKPILDRDEAKKDAAALAKELGDILEVKVDASPENLDELTKEFNAQLKTMGKQPIVFSEKTLRGIVSQFTNAIAEGISAGVAKVDFGAQLEELNKKREKILKAQNRANQAMKSRTRMERLENFNINTAELLPMDGDVAKEAQQIVDTLYDSADKIDKASEKYGKSSSHYTSAVMDAQEAYNKYLRMQKTLGKMPQSKLSEIPKDVRALYDKLGPDREKYEASGGTNVPFEETFEAEKILDSFEELSDAFESIVDNATKYNKMLVQIDAKIEEITRKAREAGGVDDGILSGAKDGLKTLNEIEAAYKRLKVDRGTKLRQQNELHIKSALDFDPDKSDVGIKTFARNYYDAAASGDWVEEYHALLRYVKLYESYLTSTNKTHQNKVTAKNNPFTPLYEQLKPMAENARNMLQNILNMGDGKPLVGMGGTEVGDGGSGPTPEDVVNAKKIREESEAKVRAEREALELARQKREEEEKLAKAAEKKKLADEATAKAAEQQRINTEASVGAAREELDLTKQRVQALEQLDKTIKENTKPGQRIETAAQLDSKTGKIDRFVVGNADGVELPGSVVEDTEWGKQKSHLDTGVHTHWTDTAAPSPKDLQTFKERLNYQRLEIIRAMQEALFLDFSKISDKALKQLIDNYTKIANDINQQFKDMPIADRIKSFGGDGNYDEPLQQRLKEEFTKLVKDMPGFAEYVQKPVWPDDIAGGKDAKNTVDSLGTKTSLDDLFANANEELKELIKNYAILTRNISHNIGDEKSFDQLDDIEEKFAKIAPELLDIPSGQWKSFGENILVTEQAVDGLNESLEKTQQLTSGDNTGAGVGDASPSEFEAERAKAESLQTEIEQKNSALNAVNEEKQALQNDLDATRQQLEDSEHEKSLYDSAMNQLTEESNEKDRVIYDLREQLANDGDALFTAEQRANEAEERASQLEKKLAEGIGDGDKKQGVVNIEELKTLLSSIENDSEQKEAPWALESTLQTVKGALENIQKNTANIGAVKSSKNGVGVGATSSKQLTDIQKILSSINGKISKGGSAPAKTPVTNNTKPKDNRDTSIKSLLNDYKTLAKLSAQFNDNSSSEIKEKIKILEAEIKTKRKSLNLTVDENSALRNQYVIAKDIEKRLLEADKADKKNKKQSANNLKLAKKQAMVGKAGSAVGRAEGVWLEASDINVPGLDKKLEEYQKAFETLRVAQHKVSTGDVVTTAQKTALQEQTKRVNKLTEEIGGLVSEYQRLSGSNTQKMGISSTLGVNSSITAYEQTLKQAVKQFTEGKAQIKGFNAETKTLTYTLKTGANEFTTYTAAVRHLDKQLVTTQGTTKRTETFMEATRRKMKEISSYVSGMAMFNRISQEFRKGIQYIREIDAAMTELRKVTDATEETYDKFLKTAAKTASRIGSTTREVISSTADWARLGYSIKEAAEFAESTQVLMNVSEFTDVSQATDTLISSVQAFGYTAKTSMDVVDLLNTIGKQNCRGNIVIYS